ncbi:unnamed protein product [Meloidogyne enterolobii]|uniref:Uncharacterized protein n=1 Tax=Meloidogyne enterolobii TaxID=390850 RepID=A0ACB0YCH2_MELEN
MLFRNFILHLLSLFFILFLFNFLYLFKYPEYSLAELYRRSLNPQAQQQQQESVHNLPVYYGHLAERICPIVDILLQKAISMDLKPAVMDTLLCHFSPIYRIHRKFIF